jgi:hypothetical protein
MAELSGEFAPGTEKRVSQINLSARAFGWVIIKGSHSQDTRSCFVHTCDLDNWPDI